MPRTTPNLVKGVLLRDYDTANAPDLTPFIRAAYTIVSRVATCAAAKGITLSAEELKEIETWLAAHAYCQSDPTYAEKGTERARGRFTGQTGTHLDSTRYGQFASGLDPSGCLVSIASGKIARAAWLGKPESEQLTYDERN